MFKVKSMLIEFTCDSCNTTVRSEQEGFFDKDLENLIVVCPVCQSEKKITLEEILMSAFKKSDKHQNIKTLFNAIIKATQKIFDTDDFTLMAAMITYLNTVDGYGNWTISDIKFTDVYKKKINDGE